MKWIVAIALAVTLFPLMLIAILAVRKSARGKGRMGGAMLAIGFAFAMMFDPAKAAAIETIQKKKDVGDSESGEGGELLD